MKVTKLVSFDQEVDIELSVEEITQAIYEEPDCTKGIFYGLNNVAVFLKAIPDEEISKLSIGQRKCIKDFLTCQVDRF